MFERQSKRVVSTASVKPNDSSLSVGTDLLGEPVYLSGEVIPSRVFADAMLTLGKVVQIQRPVQKDHSEYQKWVEGEYLRILNQREPERASRHSEISQRIALLEPKRDKLFAIISQLQTSINQKRQKYFDWLYENDRNVWIVLDPIVSVQKDGTFFEAFSGDESIYARVFLPHSALSAAEKPSMGTTNIDYSMLLEREFSRVRSYRPLSLTVGLNSVDFKTEAATVEEEKIPLPESWVRGLVEVQSVLSLAPISFDLSPDSLAEVIARLQSEKEKVGPRSLKFHLKPNNPIRIEIEPWGDVFVDDWLNYEGELDQVIRIWGRRRLNVLKESLVGAETVRVTFLGSGMPSFWTIIKDGIELTIGLSGWTSNDWASKAKFSAFIPTSTVDESRIPAALEVLKKLGSCTATEFAEKTGFKIGESNALLQKLCLQGKVMFDPPRNIYRWRDLFPTLDIYQENDASREERAGLQIHNEGSISITLNDFKGDIHYLSGVSKNNNGEFAPSLELDLDGRPKYAHCNCPFYNFNKLRQGPCRHMVALILAGE